MQRYRLRLCLKCGELTSMQCISCRHVFCTFPCLETLVEHKNGCFFVKYRRGEVPLEQAQTIVTAAVNGDAKLDRKTLEESKVKVEPQAVKNVEMAMDHNLACEDVSTSGKGEIYEKSMSAQDPASMAKNQDLSDQIQRKLSKLEKSSKTLAYRVMKDKLPENVKMGERSSVQNRLAKVSSNAPANEVSTVPNNGCDSLANEDDFEKRLQQRLKAASTPEREMYMAERDLEMKAFDKDVKKGALKLNVSVDMADLDSLQLHELELLEKKIAELKQKQKASK